MKNGLLFYNFETKTRFFTIKYNMLRIKYSVLFYYNTENESQILLERNLTNKLTFFNYIMLYTLNTMYLIYSEYI